MDNAYIIMSFVVVFCVCFFTLSMLVALNKTYFSHKKSQHNRISNVGGLGVLLGCVVGVLLLFIVPLHIQPQNIKEIKEAKEHTLSTPTFNPTFLPQIPMPYLFPNTIFPPNPLHKTYYWQDFISPNMSQPNVLDTIKKNRDYDEDDNLVSNTPLFPHLNYWIYFLVGTLIIFLSGFIEDIRSYDPNKRYSIKNTDIKTKTQYIKDSTPNTTQTKHISSSNPIDSSNKDNAQHLISNSKYIAPHHNKTIITPFMRIVIQSIGVLVACIGADMYVKYIGFGVEIPIVAGVLFSVIGAVWLCNAFGVVDGFNGLGGGVALCVCVSIGVVAFSVDMLGIFFMCLILGISLLGFLIWNIPNGKIFLGSGGAYFVGFVLAIIIMILTQSMGSSVSAWYGICVLIYPIWEMLFITFIAKILTKKTSKEYLPFHIFIFRRLGDKPITSLICVCAQFPFIALGTLFYSNTIALIITSAMFVVIYIITYMQLVKNQHLS